MYHIQFYSQVVGIDEARSDFQLLKGYCRSLKSQIAFSFEQIAYLFWYFGQAIQAY